jgi:hypothetical protein
VPAEKSPAKVKIPVTIAIPDTPGPDQATVQLQGFALADCLMLSPAYSRKYCGQAGSTAGTAVTLGDESVFLPVTPLVQRGFRRAKVRAVTVPVPLTKLGKALFAKLQAKEQARTLAVQMHATLHDREGHTITAVFPVTLRRQR